MICNMTNEELIAKIKAEIKRRLKYTHDWFRGDEKRHPNKVFISKNYYKMKGDERTLDALLSFLSTIEEPVCEELKVEAEKYVGNQYGYELECQADLKDRIEHIRDFISGAKWQKELMMKETVEVEVESFSDMHPEVSIPLNPTMFNVGDKVRVIIIPNTDEKWI